MAWGINGGKKADEAGTRALTAAQEVEQLIPKITESNQLAKDAKVESGQAKVTANQADTKAQQSIDRANQIIANAGNSNTEIVDGRIKSDGTIAPTIGGHLRELGTQLADKAQQVELTNAVSRIDLNSFARYGYLDQSYFPYQLGFNLYRDINGKILHDFNFPALSDGFPNVYLSFRNGLDSNDGLTIGTAVKTIEQALIIANADASGTVNIVFLEKIYQRTSTLSATLSKNINFLSAKTDGTLICTSYSPETYTWAFENGVYRTSRSATYKVFDTKFKDFRGLPKDLLKTNTLAECQAKRGSWYTDGTLAYVNREDGSSPASDYGLALMLPINVAIVLSPAGHRLYIDNVKFALRSNTTSTNALTINGDVNSDIIINRSGFIHAKNMGFAISSFRTAFLFNSIAEYCAGDGFNYHGNSSSKVFEYYCYSHHHGVDSGLENINATTAHDGMSVIRVGSIGHDTKGPVLADVNACKSVNIDCIMHTSLRSPGKEKAAFYFDNAATTSEGYGYVINSQGGGTDTVAINSDSKIALYLQNFRGKMPLGLTFVLME